MSTNGKENGKVMTKTEYLTGQKPERYAHLLKPLADMRIKDMSELLATLSHITEPMDKKSEEYKVYERRYIKAEKALNWWKDLLNEGRDAY